MDHFDDWHFIWYFQNTNHVKIYGEHIVQTFLIVKDKRSLWINKNIVQSYLYSECHVDYRT